MEGEGGGVSEKLFYRPEWFNIFSAQHACNKHNIPRCVVCHAAQTANTPEPKTIYWSPRFELVAVWPEEFD